MSEAHYQQLYMAQLTSKKKTKVSLRMMYYCCFFVSCRFKDSHDIKSIQNLYCDVEQKSLQEICNKVTQAHTLSLQFFCFCPVLFSGLGRCWSSPSLQINSDLLMGLGTEKLHLANYRLRQSAITLQKENDLPYTLCHWRKMSFRSDKHTIDFIANMANSYFALCTLITSANKCLEKKISPRVILY